MTTPTNHGSSSPTAEPDPNAAYWTIAQVARRLTVSERFVHRLIADDLLAVSRFGRLVRIKPADVLALEEAARHAPAGGRRG